MSDNQKEQLAWVTRAVQIILLAIATGVGANVYTKVDKIYTEISVQRSEIDHLSEKVDRLEQENDRRFHEERTSQKEFYQLRDAVRNINSDMP